MSDSAAHTAAGAAKPGYEAKPYEPETLDETIAKVQEAADKAKTEKEKADSASAALDGHLAALLTLKKDSDKAQQTYSAAHEQLAIDQQAFEDYLESAKESLDDQLEDDGVAKVTELNTTKENDDEARAGAVETAQEKLDEAKAAAEAAEQNRKATAAGVVRYKQLAATIGAGHAKLKSLRDEATKARQANQPGLAYWLLVDLGEHRGFEAQLADVRGLLIDPEKLPAQLLTAVNELAGAETTKAAADAAVVRLQAELTTAQRALADQQANGEKKLREDLAQIPAAPAAYAASAATA